VGTKPQQREPTDIESALAAEASDAPAHESAVRSGDTQTGSCAHPGQPAGESWRALLSGMSPREALARLLQGDPLELRRVVARRLAERAYLFDADRVHLRALAYCARYAVRYRGNPPLEEWLSQTVDQATLDLLRDDAEAERRGTPADPEDHAALVNLARPLGLEPQAMRRVCLAHNLQREPERQAFFALVICGRSLDEAARTLGLSAVELARRARRGLEVVLLAAEKPAEAHSGAARQASARTAAQAGEPQVNAALPTGAKQVPS
jgi:DNA-directed RNA polymerase specialized sigma24 family protein